MTRQNHHANYTHIYICMCVYIYMDVCVRMPIYICMCAHTLRRIRKCLIVRQHCKKVRDTRQCALARAAGNLNYRSMSTNEIRSRPNSTRKKLSRCGTRKGMPDAARWPSGACRSYVKIAREIGLHSASSSKKGAYFLAILHYVASDVGILFKGHERITIGLVSNDTSFRNSRNLSGMN